MSGLDILPHLWPHSKVSQICIYCLEFSLAYYQVLPLDCSIGPLHSIRTKLNFLPSLRNLFIFHPLHALSWFMKLGHSVPQTRNLELYLFSSHPSSSMSRPQILLTLYLKYMSWLCFPLRSLTFRSQSSFTTPIAFDSPSVSCLTSFFHWHP